jgi:hypothetical protein
MEVFIKLPPPLSAMWASMMGIIATTSSWYGWGTIMATSQILAVFAIRHTPVDGHLFKRFFFTHTAGC